MKQTSENKRNKIANVSAKSHINKNVKNIKL